MGQLRDTVRRRLEKEKVRIVAFFGMKRQDEPPFFLAGIWPVEPDESATAILDPSKFYATVQADSPEEAIRLFKDKLYGGL